MIKTVLLSAFLFTACPMFSKAESDHLPNIVFFFADDMGYADLGCYGHPYAVTPALDKLASEGTRFSQHYATGVTCNPSRTGLMTGLFPARYPKKTADFGFGEQATITELLKQRGYKTGHFGKWHIGPKSTIENGTYGIDDVQVIGSSKDREGDFELTQAAIEFMKKNADHPFYVNIWGHSTHFPVDVIDELSEKFLTTKVDRNDFSKTIQHKFDESLALDKNLDASMHQYLGDVYSIDQNVNQILNTIDKLGLRDNTIFVFSSDHGPAPVSLGAKKLTREFSKNMLGYAGEYRGGKHTQFEGGTRVPLIIRWPGHVKAGRVDTKNVTSFIDWLPTLCAITGIEKLPKQLDGEDISDIWRGDDRERSKPLYWKTSATGSSPAMREGFWKLHLNVRKGEKTQLYDLSNDLSESKNVAKENPKVVSQMSAKINAWVAELPSEYVKKKSKK